MEAKGSKIFRSNETMNHITVALNTTWCPDTPENWAEFERLKEGLQELRASPRTDFDRALKQQVARENKRLKSYRAWLPGLGPNQ